MKIFQKNIHRSQRMYRRKMPKIFFLNHFKLLFSDAEENGYLAHIKDIDLPSLVEWLKTKHQVT